MADAILKNEYDDYKCCANDVIHFKMVRHVGDLENEEIDFLPEMTHQIFGDAESIFGYRDLTVQVYYTAASLNSYVNMKYSDKIGVKKNTDGLLADEVLPKIVEQMAPGVYTKLDDLVNSLDKEDTFHPFGSRLHSYKVIDKDNMEHNFEVYKTSIDEPGFRDYHTRLQTFILYYIDAASFIDVDDDMWSYYLTFERYKSSTGQSLYAIVGYMTVYSYYAYPEKTRPRISQMLMLPPFKGQGHGSQLLQSFYNNMYTHKDVLDITVESPSEEFQKMRDFVDARNCRTLKSYQKEELLKGFNSDKWREAQEKLKLSKKQARRVYEILRLKVSENDGAIFKDFRLEVKRRLYAPFTKNGPSHIPMPLATGETETMTIEQRMQYLEQAFQDDIAEYRHVLERLDTYG